MMARCLALAIAGAFAVSVFTAGPAQAVCDPHCSPKSNKGGEVRGLDRANVSPVNMANRGETMLLRSKVLSRHRCLRPMGIGTAFQIPTIDVRPSTHREQAMAVR